MITRKVLYFAIVGKEYGGVEQKIIGQFDALSALNVDIELILISKHTPGITLCSEINKRRGIEVLVNKSRNIKRPWARRKEKFFLIDSVLAKYAPAETLVYFRDPLADIHFLRFLKRNNKYLFITEHQDIENTFLKGKIRGRLIINILELIWGRKYRQYISGFVGVTEEITEYEKRVVKQKGHYFKTIGNGIDIKKYPLRNPLDDVETNEVRILFVGSGFRTHGLDRLIKSIDKYIQQTKQPSNVILKIAGDSHEMHINKRLSAKLGLSSRIIFTGNLENKDLDQQFNWAHIGVGSLGIHRKGLKYTSELKAREYCARGLPFFWSTFDSDFIPKWPFILEVPENNCSFDLNPVVEFANRIRADRFHHVKMREYACEHLDWSVKMTELISFFNDITNKKFEEGKA